MLRLEFSFPRKVLKVGRPLKRALRLLADLLRQFYNPRIKWIELEKVKLRLRLMHLFRNLAYCVANETV